MPRSETDIVTQSIWHIASGSDGREYSRVFLRTGIAAVGDRDEHKPWMSAWQGDLVVLREGSSRTRIRAIGSLADEPGTYEVQVEALGLEAIDGWTLDAARRVNWRV